MRISPLAVLLTLASLAAGPSRAEEITDTGWKISCDDAGCQIALGGYALWTTADSDPAALKILQSLPDISAVTITGALQNMGDASADIVLRKAQAAQNIHEGNLQALQGDWAPVGEDTPYFIRFVGLEMQEWVTGELGDSFALVAGESCADGTVHQGTVLSLYRLGDDPEADGCRVIEYIDAQTLSLRDVSGAWGVVDYRRVQ